MNIYDFREHDHLLPEDIADNMIEQLKTLCEKGEINATFDDESEKLLYQDLYDTLTYLKICCDNQFNFDFFRTFYQVLSDLTEYTER